MHGLFGKKLSPRGFSIHADSRAIPVSAEKHSPDRGKPFANAAAAEFSAPKTNSKPTKRKHP